MPGILMHRKYIFKEKDVKDQSLYLFSVITRSGMTGVIEKYNN